MKKHSIRAFVRSIWTKWIIALAVVAGAALTSSNWWPVLDRWIDGTVAAGKKHSVEGEGGNSDDAQNQSHEDHGHDHGAHSDSASLELTPQSLKNLGLTSEYLRPVELTDFFRTLTVPAIIVAKPGRTDIHVSSPMIGIVQHVHAVTGEVVIPGDLLFEVRLTYEDLVDTQTQLLKNLADKAVEEREIKRLEEVTRTGAVASKLLLERQYSLQKIESSLASQRSALQLHGLSEEQIDTIVRDKRLLRDLSIVAPRIDNHAHELDRLRLSGGSVIPTSFQNLNETVAGNVQTTPLIVERLRASKGQGVQAGEMLCTLSDYSSLYVEGKAFEQDAPAIAEAAAKGWPIEAIFSGVAGFETVAELKLAYVSNSVDPQSRTLSFFVDLPNAMLRDETTNEGQRFVIWKYRVGQRLELRVPVEVWEQQIVLPVDATVKDGADWFVFQQNGDHFDRVAVHVKHRDQRYVVIENDGAIYPGDVVALRSAHQMQMAIKNKSGAGADPHAGHDH